MPLPLAGFFLWRFDVSGGEIKRVKLRRGESRLTKGTSLPPVSPTVSSTSVSESTAGGDDATRPSDRDTSKSRYSSYFKPVGGYIDGWIIDQNAPEEAVRITILVDDIAIATLLADRERPHLKKKFDIASTAHGFRVLVPDRFRDGTLHAISLGVVGSNYRRDAREEFQVPPSEIAPYLEVLGISEGTIDGRIYHADGQDPPEIWFGETVLSFDDYRVEWGPSEQASRTFRIRLSSHSAEDLLVRSAQISVAHGGASGHAVFLSHFVGVQVVRISRGALSIGAAIPFPALDRARCRLEVSTNSNFHESPFSLSIDLSLGVNEVRLPADFHDCPFWARLLLVGGPSPVELLAPTRVSAFSEASDPAAGGSVTSAGAGPIYAYTPGEGAANQGQQQARDPSLHMASIGGDGPEARLSITSDGSGTRPFLRLAANEAGSDTQLRFVFSGNGLQAGDLLHLRWVERSGRLQSAGTPEGKIALSFSLDGVSSPKVWEETVALRPQWHDHHAILRLSAATREMAVELTAPTGCTLDVGGLAVGRIASAADTRPQATGDISPVELADVLSYPVEQPPPTIAPANYGRFGLVATLGPNGISGIAWSNDNVRRSTQLQLLVDGEIAGFASAEPVGSFEKGVAPGSFIAPLPQAARDARPHVVDVQFMGTRESLLGAPRALTANSRHDGAAWLTPAGHLAGWAADPDEGAGPVEVEIRVDGRALARILADAQHPMFSDSAHNNGRCAFSYIIPPSVRDGRLHTITAHTTAGVELSGSPILATLKKGVSTLHIDPTLSGWIKGWVATPTPPMATGVVEVAVDGEYFGTVRAERSHDGETIAEGARFRFSFRVPSYASKVRLSSPELGVDAELDVVRIGDASTLRPTENTAPPTTSKDYSAARAALLADPDQYVDADWYFAAYPIASLETARGRRQSAAEHWLETGAKRGWSPTPWFDERWYLGGNPDAAAAVASGEAGAGYLHWLAIGAQEWRSPGPTFNPLEYRRSRPLPEDGADRETAFDVVREWLRQCASGDFSIPAEHQSEPALPEPGRSLFRRIVTSRWDKATVFDTHVGRLLEDLRIRGHEGLDQLRRMLDDNEVEIVRNVIDYPEGDEPLVSIIMPTFNRAYVIAEGIQSVLDQSWQNWELIVCDDGSFDKTPQVVRQFTDSRIRYLQLEKSNGAIARNYGIKFARGTYVAFLDSDNIWHPLFLSLTINKLRSSIRPAVYAGYIDTSSDAVRYTEATIKFTPFDYMALVARNYIDLNSLVVRRDLFDALGSFDETLPRVQDWDLALRLLRFFDPLEVRCAVAFYRRNPSWGQVTDLAAHTDYTKVVRQRALDRLSGRTPANLSLPQSTVSLYAGSTAMGLEVSLSFARLLSAVAEVQLILQDTPAQRGAIGRFELQGRVRTAWLRGPERISNHVAGRALFVPGECAAAELEGLPGNFPIAEFRLFRERLVVRDRRLPGDPGITLGALRPDTLSESEIAHESELAARDRGDVVAVLTPAPMRQRWLRALARRKLRGTVLWFEGNQIHAVEADSAEAKSQKRSFRDQLQRINSLSALLLAAGTGEDSLRSASLGIEAQRHGVTLVASSDQLYEEWVSGKYAHLAPDDPEAAADLLVKVLNDRAGSQRLRTRSRRLFDYLYRPDVVKSRLAITISFL